MSIIDIASIRKDYKLKSLSEDDVLQNAVLQFDIWFKEALAAEVAEPNAMVLSTVGERGKPSSRVVLIKEYDQTGFTFFTNYHSQKGTDMLLNPSACLNFFWPQLERQIRIEGIVEKVSEQESIEYFNSRPWESRVGAWVSNQSSEVSNRKTLEDLFEELNAKFKREGNIPKPSYWGGYLLKPSFIEFWQGRPSRLHDRICYEYENNNWRIFRLAP